MDDKLLGLILLCLPLSLLSFGGGQTVVAGLQHETVIVHGWLSAQDFTNIFAISRATPGPSSLIVALIGWHVAGLWGALAASLAMFVPSSIVTAAVGQWWETRGKSRLGAAIQKGLLPIAVGLIFSGALGVAQLADLGPLDIAVIAGCCLVLWFSKLGPYPILGTVGALYLGLSFLGF